MKFERIVCPISQVKIDSNVSRLTSFMVSILIALYAYTRVPYYMIIVVVDYSIRAFGNPLYSPLRWLADGIVRLFRFSGPKIDQAPKIFASRLGFLCATVSALLFYFQALVGSVSMALLLLCFTILDSVFNFCVGCIIYHYIVFPFYQRKLSHSKGSV